jgi:plastocyanin
MSGLLAALCLFTAFARAGEQTVDQKDKTFMVNGAKVTTVKVKVGDVVLFRNLDPYFHNVFSLSERSFLISALSRKDNPGPSPSTKRARSKWSAPSIRK